MNNIINDRRSLITTSNDTNLLFISTVGPPSQAWDPDPYVKTFLNIVLSNVFNPARKSLEFKHASQ